MLTDDDCQRCLATVERDLRLDMGCGYETPSERPRSIPLSDQVRDLTTCPAYTTSLPDVVDVAWVWPHWDRGQLQHALGDLEPGRGLTDSLRILAGAINEQQVAAMRRDGGAS